MKRLIILLLSVVVFSGCALTPMGEANAPQAAIDAQARAEQILTAFAASLKAAQGVADTLYDNQVIGKDDYNTKILPVYNQALASFQLLKDAFDKAKATGQDPNRVKEYADAMSAFLLDQNNLNSLITALGGAR